MGLALSKHSLSEDISESLLLIDSYKKSSHKLVEKLDAQSARIADGLKLDDRIEKLAKKVAFITLKDHKPNFQDHPSCRLINPSKPEIGVINKHILDEINTSITSSSKINQWKNTSSVLKWFKCLENKNSLSCICFDVCEFYPSITEKLLSKALEVAFQTTPSPQQKPKPFPSELARRLNTFLGILVSLHPEWD